MYVREDVESELQEQEHVVEECDKQLPAYQSNGTSAKIATNFVKKIRKQIATGQNSKISKTQKKVLKKIEKK